MSCLEISALALVAYFVYLWINATRSRLKPGPAPLAPEPVALGVPAEGPRLEVEIRRNEQSQWAWIRVHLLREMPTGLVVAMHANARAEVVPGALDERTFYLLAEALGKDPRRIVDWATPDVQQALLRAYWALGHGFQLNRGLLTATVPVSGAGDPVVPRAAAVLVELVRRLGATAPFLPEAVLAGEGPAVLASGPVEPPAPAPAPEAEPVPVPVPAPVPAPMPAPVPVPAPMPAPVPVPVTGATSAPASAPERESPAASAAPWRAGSAVIPAVSTPEPAGAAPDTVEALLAAITARSGDGAEAQERWVAETWRGKRLPGRGKLSFSSTVFGRDLDFETTVGVKLTLEVALPGQSSFFTPKVLLHLATPLPAGAGGLGHEVRFAATVRAYRGVSRTLLMEDGSVED
jgi:hypothetical protein